MIQKEQKETQPRPGDSRPIYLSSSPSPSSSFLFAFRTHSSQLRRRPQDLLTPRLTHPDLTTSRPTTPSTCQKTTDQRPLPGEAAGVWPEDMGLTGSDPPSPAPLLAKIYRCPRQAGSQSVSVTLPPPTFVCLRTEPCQKYSWSRRLLHRLVHRLKYNP